MKRFPKRCRIAKLDVTNGFCRKQFTQANPYRRRLRWSVIPGVSEWRAASATSRFAILDRRASPEIVAIDNAVAGDDGVAVKPNVPTAALWQVVLTLFEAIEVYRATARGAKQPRLDAVNDLRAVTMATLSKLRWEKYKEVTGGHKHGMKPMVQHVWSARRIPQITHASATIPSRPLDPDPWLQGKTGAQEKYHSNIFGKCVRKTLTLGTTSST